MNINGAFPSKFMKSSELDGDEPVVIIDRVAVEPIGQDKEMKPVIYFQGLEKGLVLNRTNSKKISDIAGTPETDKWRGVEIKLYVAEVQFKADTVEAIRIKSPLKKESKSAQVELPQGKDSIPF